MNVSGEDAQQPPGSAVTVATWWRRRQVALLPAPPDDQEKLASGPQITDALAIIDSPPDKTARGFTESQQAGLAAAVSLAKAVTPGGPLPAAKSAAPQLEPPAQGRPASAPHAQPVPSPVMPSPVTASPVTASPVIDPPGIPVRPDPATPGRLAARRAQASRRRRVVWSSHAFAHARALPLTAILAAQAVLSLRLVWSNTAFPDEALYLWSGRLQWAHWLHGTSIPDFPTYFSGAPVVYPPLGALATALGGLAGGRILSLCFMLSATALLHGVTRRLFDRRSADFAAALFVGLGATQFLGAFATYDAMALFLLALATWLGVRSAGTRLSVQVPLLLGVAGALAMADAAKYAATLFDPVVIVLAGLATWRAGSRKKGIVTALAILWALCLLLFLGIRLGGQAYWRGINYTTLSRARGESSAAGIIADSFGWVALIVVLVLIGSAVAIVKQTEISAKLCACVLACAIVLAPANQARIHVFTSLFKHVGFGAWFAAAVGGYALASLADAVPAVKKRRALMASTGVAVAGLLVGASLAQTHFVSWPDTASFVARLRTVLPAHKGRVLAADNGNVIEFYLPGELGGMIFNGPWFLRYQDPQTGNYLIERPAYADAIRHRYFSVIALSFGDSHATDEIISQDIRSYGGYKLVATLPYRAAGLHSAFRIWVRENSG